MKTITHLIKIMQFTAIFENVQMKNRDIFFLFLFNTKIVGTLLQGGSNEYP